MGVLPEELQTGVGERLISNAVKVLVFGAGGQLGAELLRACRQRDDDVTGLSHREHDITDAAANDEVIHGLQPDVVFNAAAYTAVDRAESEPEAAEAINGRAPGLIAQSCVAAGARLVHYSTDYVFDGMSRPIAEDAAPEPASVYGRSKLMGEEAVANAGASSYIVRSSWLFGTGGPNFVLTVLRLARERGEMRIVNDQRGNPTWSRDLALASRRLVEVGEPAVYHITNSGECTWYELATTVVSRAGLPAKVLPITTSEYPTAARRPSYSVLANRRWLELGEPPLRPWGEAVAEYLGEVTTR